MERRFEALLREYLELFPCVGIIGPRQCGKTTLLTTLPRDWKVFDLEKSSDFQVVRHDPDLFFRLNSRSVAIDEAQVCPEIFPALRVAIDEDRRTRGRFVITGSSSPVLQSVISESLAGRIGIIEMSPLMWAELYPQGETSPVELLSNPHTGIDDLLAASQVRADITAVHDYWFGGGYPEPWLDGTQRFRDAWMEQYIRTYLYRDLGRLFPGLNQSRFQRFLQLLAGLSGTVINYASVARALGVSQPTARDYFEIAHGTFLWRQIPPYLKNPIKRLVKHPKGYLRDPGLHHHLLRIPDRDALLGHPQMGQSWEALVIEEILRQLHSRGIGFDAYFYRTSAGAEVDLILEGAFGLIPIEIKHTGRVYPRDLRTMKSFLAENPCRLGLVINNDEHPRQYDERIIGIPFSHL